MLKNFVAFRDGNELEHTNVNDSFFKVTNVGYTILNNLEQKKNKPTDASDIYLYIYIKCGTMELTIEKNTYTLTEGYACIIPPTVSCSYTFKKEPVNEHYYVFFGGQGTKGILKELKLDKTLVFNSATHKNYAEKIILMYNNFKNNKFSYQIINTSLFLQVLTNSAVSFRKIPLFTQESSILPALKKMQEFYHENLSLDEYAKLCNMSKWTFLRKFKDEKKVTPQKYIANIKLNIAKELLETTNLCISEIAQNLGFEDAYYFSNFFKKNVGMSPLNYRKTSIKK